MEEKLIYQYQFTSDYPVLQFVIFRNYDLCIAHANTWRGKKNLTFFFPPPHLLNPSYCGDLAKESRGIKSRSGFLAVLVAGGMAGWRGWDVWWGAWCWWGLPTDPTLALQWVLGGDSPVRVWW